jgi:hypothetical protein
MMEHYGFEGWLVNIENAIDADDIDALKDFLVVLGKSSKQRIPSAQVCVCRQEIYGVFAKDCEAAQVQSLLCLKRVRMAREAFSDAAGLAYTEM